MWFNKLMIKWRIIILIAGIGVILSTLLAFYAPGRAKILGRNILENDVRFIANLLADNLAVGMQTMILDEGATLDQTLAMLKTIGTTETQAITDVNIFDATGNFVKGLYSDTQPSKTVQQVTELMMLDEPNRITTWSPILDVDHNLLGIVAIDFSKHHLNTQANRNALASVTIALIFLGATLFMAVVLSRNITMGILRATDIMKDIAEGEGDLTRRLPTDSNDEVGRLNKWINAFMDKLHDLIGGVKDNTAAVSSAATQISTASVELASGAEEQTAQASEVSASVEEMTASIMQNSQSASQTAKISEESTKIAQSGQEAMSATQKGMDEIVASTERMSQIIQSLTGRAGQIDEIVKVIDKIADQTNLLALNAAVEAARAGEQGAGFAVVADEVRKLAERTTDSTKQIGTTIEAIQNETKLASETMKESLTNVLRGKEATEQTEIVLNKITATVTQAMDMIQQIAAASEEQSAGAEEISSSVEAIGSVTKQASTSAETMAAAAQELSAQTAILTQVVSQFKLSEST